MSFNFMAAVMSTEILEPKKIKSVSVASFLPSYLPWGVGTGCYDFGFLNVELLRQLFISPLSPSSMSSLVPFHFLPLGWCHLQIPWTEEPDRLQSMGLLESDTTSLSLFTFMHRRRKCQPIPVFLPGESQGQESRVGCRLWGRTESDTTEAT